MNRTGEKLFLEYKNFSKMLSNVSKDSIEN